MAEDRSSKLPEMLPTGACSSVPQWPLVIFSLLGTFMTAVVELLLPGPVGWGMSGCSSFPLISEWHFSSELWTREPVPAELGSLVTFLILCSSLLEGCPLF